MMETLAVAKNARFQILSKHADENLTIDPNYFGINIRGACRHPADAQFSQDTFDEGRTEKRAFYKAVASAPDIVPQDGFINSSM